ncbi:DUF3006 domain-containing protein [Natrialbaceae archaeon A-CW2]
MDGTYTGVVDRIVNGETAVILLEEDGEVVDQLYLPVDRVPERARNDGGVVSVMLETGEVDSIAYLPDETRRRRESAQSKLDRLSKRLSDREE